MKAMILAAGIGSRLRPLTDGCPKAMIEVGGMPMLEIAIRRLKTAGVTDIVVNTFHLADQIAKFLKAKKNFKVRIELSQEKELLDTGGGLKKVAGFFDDRQPFFLHNADVLTDLDLGKMYRHHEKSKALATLAVSSRESGRYLLFDADGRLRGRETSADKKIEWAGAPAKEAERLAFNGIHVISPTIFPKMTGTGAFSITKTYLRLAGQGEKIHAYRMDEYYWQDIGSPEKLEKVRRYIKEQGLPL